MKSHTLCDGGMLQKDGFIIDGEEKGNENGFEEAKKACDQDSECLGFVKGCDYGDYWICNGTTWTEKTFEHNPCCDTRRLPPTCDSPDLTLYRKGKYVKTNNLYNINLR